MQPGLPTPTSTIYENDQVVGILLDNAIEIEILQGTYKEYRPTGAGQEIYVAQVTYGENEAKVVGPTSHIVALYFVEPEDSTI